MATQLGATSFVSAPAFVAVKDGGGMKWLCYEFGVLIGILIVMAVIIPTILKGKFISIYEYLEERFDEATHTIVSFLFRLSWVPATVVSVLAGGIILSTALGISTSLAIILVGVITILYDVLGGIGVVILSHVLQMIIIAVGIFVCGGLALSMVGWDGAWASKGPSWPDPNVIRFV